MKAVNTLHLHEHDVPFVFPFFSGCPLVVAVLWAPHAAGPPPVHDSVLPKQLQTPAVGAGTLCGPHSFKSSLSSLKEVFSDPAIN